MGTQGLVGWVIDGEVKAAYNHFDSYPSGLGTNVFTYVRERLDSVEGWRERVRGVEMVNETTPGLPESNEALASEDLLRRAREAGLVNTSVGGRSKDVTVYQALRDAQGDLTAYEKVQAMPDSREFAADSLFCEWGYLVNLDDGKVEVYKGFQREPHDRGRFSTLTNDDDRYFPIALLTEVSFNEIAEVVDATLVDRIERLSELENA